MDYQNNPVSDDDYFLPPLIGDQEVEEDYAEEVVADEILPDIIEDEEARLERAREQIMEDIRRFLDLNNHIIALENDNINANEDEDLLLVEEFEEEIEVDEDNNFEEDYEGMDEIFDNDINNNY